MATAGAWRALLSGVVDYAGLFPPAGLDMADAVTRYAAYRRGRRAWMLGRFVVPLARLGAFEAAAGPLLPRGPGAAPWRVSVIASGSPVEDAAAIEAFNAAHRDEDAGGAIIDSVERRAATVEEVHTAAAALTLLPVRVALEVPLGAVAPAIARAVAQAGGVLKARLGGITPEAIPTPQAVASWLAAGAGAGVRVKATAGLHHAVRGAYRLTYDDHSPRAVMHGFVNVFVAAALAWRHRRAPGLEIEARCLPVLQETDPRAFRASGDTLAWRDEVVGEGELEDARASFAAAFGSCSFEEPVEELQALGILGA
jgi:hypothetical protein